MATHKQTAQHDKESGSDTEEASLLLQSKGNPVKSASQYSLHNTMAEITIKRPAYDQATFDDTYGKVTIPELPLRQRVNKCCSETFACSGKCVTKKLLSFFPFIMMLKMYKWKNWILKDIIAGICVGVIHIPQSMGFSILTSLPPVYGLYSTFFPALIYFFFGTSRHISMGTMAVISIMIGTVVDREADLYKASLQTNSQISNLSSTFITTIIPVNDSITEIGDDELVQFKVGIAVSVSLMMGLFLLGMSLFNLGTLATFMSSSFVGGFMTGAACHIITSQAPFGFGFTVPRQAGIFRVPKSWYLIFANITQTNPAAIITFILSATFLMSCKIINDKFKKQLKVPIPGELVVVIVSTLVSYLVNMHEKFDVRILKNIPTGIPVPEIPSFYNGPAYILDSFIISIVSYAICVSMAKNFSQKYRYPLDQNQELFALGLMHSISSFFHCFAGAQAPPRTLVHEGTGGKTQVASLFSAFLVLLVCLVLGPLFESLPNSALSAIIIVALLPLFLQFGTMPHFWRVNRFDCIIWQVTFWSSVILNMDVGLGIGIFISLLSVVVETYLAKGQVLAKANKTELYHPETAYNKLSKFDSKENVFVFKFDSPLYFANIESFKKQLFESTLNPLKMSKESNPSENADKAGAADESMDNKSDIQPELNEATHQNGLEPHSHIKKSNGHIDQTSITIQFPELQVKDAKVVPFSSIGVVVLDCSAFSYIDLMGLNTLKTLKGMYQEVGVEFLLVNCPQTLLHKMDIQGLDVTTGIYPSIQDAVAMTSELLQVTRF